MKKAETRDELVAENERLRMMVLNLATVAQELDRELGGSTYVEELIERAHRLLRGEGKGYDD